MSNAINVREVLGIEEKRPPLFFDPVGPDRYAAMDRKRITESLFEEWYRLPSPCVRYSPKRSVSSRGGRNDLL